MSLKRRLIRQLLLTSLFEQFGANEDLPFVASRPCSFPFARAGGVKRLQSKQETTWSDLESIGFDVLGEMVFVYIHASHNVLPFASYHLLG